MDNRYNIIIDGDQTLTSPLFSSMDKAKYVISVFSNKKFIIDKEIKILIPRSDSLCSKLIDLVARDRMTISEKEFGSLESKIDDIIFKLYNINDSFKKVTEDFLFRYSYEYMKKRDEEKGEIFLGFCNPKHQ